MTTNTPLTPAERVAAIFDEAVGRHCVRCGEYFTGARCKPCNRRRASAKYYANQEVHQARARQYQREHKEERAAYQKAYYAQTREKQIAASKARQEKNKAHIVAMRVIHRAKNRDRLIEKSRQYRRDNPNAKRRSEAKRRALMKKAVVCPIPKDIVERLLKLQRGKCSCCAMPLGKNFHLDHIQPLALGGEHAANNLQLLREECNKRKSAKHPVDYMQQKGFLL